MKNKDALYKIDDAIRKENVKLKIEILQKNQEIKRLNNIIKQYDKVSFIHEMELQKRIDKTIEFIYENAYNEERNCQVDDLWYEIPELLNILGKGE